MAIVYRDEKGTALTHDELDNNIRELDEIPNGKVFPSSQSIGIKLDDNTPDFGWHDMVGYLYGDLTLPNAAQYSIYRGGIKARFFEEGNEAFIDFHMPHDYVMGTDVYVHVHWSHISSIVTGGTCTWGFEMMYAKGHNQAAFQTPVNASVIDGASVISYQHMIAEIVASTDGGSSTTLDVND